MILYYNSKIKVSSKKGVLKSPGMRYKHYSPNAKVILVEGENQNEKIIWFWGNVPGKVRRNGCF